MKIKSDKIPKDHPSLTAGKVYEAVKKTNDLSLYCDNLYNIFDDNGVPTIVRPESCAFLNGHSWEIVEA